MNPLQDPRMLIWLGILLLGTMAKARGATVDPTYAPQVNGLVRYVVVQSDGKAIITGNFSAVNNTARTSVARLNLDGTLDNSFAPSLGNAYVKAIAVGAQGDIYLSGSFQLNDGDASLVRLAGNGSVLQAWDGSTGPNDSASALMVDAQNRLVLGGSFTSFGGSPAQYLARLTTSGELDGTFTSSLQSSSAMEAGVSAILAQGDKVTVSGVFKLNAVSSKLARLNADGSVDATFAPDQGQILYGHQLAAKGASVYVAGQQQAGGYAAVLGTNGSTDSTLTTDGGVIWSVATQADGAAFIGGQFSSVNGAAKQNLARINANGTVDASFSANTDQAVYAVATEATGDVLIAGAFQTVNGEARTYLARIKGETKSSFAAITCNNHNHFCTVLKTEAGATYAIEASSDLRTWNTVQTVVATSAQYNFEANQVASQQFFRARKL